MLADLEIIPLGRSGASVSALLVKVARLIDESGLDYRVGPMGTTIEGSWDQVMAVAKRCHDALLHDVERVITTIRIDDRTDKPGTGRLTQKVASLEAKVGKPLNKITRGQI